MPSATEQLTKVEDQILETISSLQKPVVDAVKTLADKAESYVPEVPKPENLPTLDELIISQFTFVEKLLANQKDFVGALLEAIKPVSSKVTAEPGAKSKSTTTKAAAA